MPLFARPKPTPADSAPTLPHGYDDPESATFVPEALRPFWQDTPPNPADLARLIEDRIQAEARERAEALQRADWDANRRLGNTGRRGEFVFDGRDYAPFTVAEQVEIIRRSPADLDRIEATAAHALRLAAAHDRAGYAARIAERDARETCPVCGEHFPASLAEPSPVKSRSFTDRGARFQMTCCADCAAAVEAARADWLRTHVVRDGKTRVQLVAEALANRP